MKQKTENPFWRSFLFPLVVTVVAIVFWLSYYGTVRWWPAVLLGVFFLNYAAFLGAERRRLP